MPLLRSVAAGVVGAVLGIMAWVIAVVGIPLAMALVRESRDGGGALGVGVSVDTGSLAVAALAGFGVAFTGVLAAPRAHGSDRARTKRGGQSIEGTKGWIG
jgi:hypothetical protein